MGILLTVLYIALIFLFILVGRKLFAKADIWDKKEKIKMQEANLHSIREFKDGTSITPNADKKIKKFLNS